MRANSLSWIASNIFAGFLKRLSTTTKLVVSFKCNFAYEFQKQSCEPRFELTIICLGSIGSDHWVATAVCFCNSKKKHIVTLGIFVHIYCFKYYIKVKYLQEYLSEPWISKILSVQKNSTSRWFLNNPDIIINIFQSFMKENSHNSPWSYINV